MATITEKMAAAKAAAASADPTNKEAPQAEPKIAGYISMRLRRFATKMGVFIYPNADGIFVPATQEEYDMLEHYADANLNYVERTPE